jgi:hypothetical protein
MRTLVKTLAGTAIAAAAACNGTILLGSGSGAVASAADTDGGASGDTDATSSVASYGGFIGAAPCTIPPPQELDAGDPVEAGAILAPLVGTWTGSYQPPQSSAVALTLVFTQQASGAVTGTLSFGTAAPPAPPTSATEIYPPGFQGGPAINETFPYPGFQYTAVAVSFDAVHLQFGIVQTELWKAWCELQTSFDQSSIGSCGCLPNWPCTGSPMGTGSCYTIAPDSSVMQPFGCALFSPCSLYPSECTCSSAGCTVDLRMPIQNANVALDLQLTSSNQLSGTISLDPSGPNIQLTLSP